MQVVKINSKILLTTLIGIMLFSNIVLAIPGVPHQFFGTVSINGSPAPDGTSVVTKIKGIEVGSTTTKNGNYGYEYPEGEGIFYVDDPNSVRTGEEIEFFVNDVNTGESEIFCNTCLDRKDLGITVSTTPGGGGGGGGGGGVPAQPEEEEETTEETGEETTGETVVTCEEKWICGGWSACVNGMQTRTCNDENSCGTNNKEPFVSQPCSIEEAIEQGGLGGILTGFFAMSPTNLAIAGAVGLVVAVAIIYFVNKRRKKKQL